MSCYVWKRDQGAENGHEILCSINGMKLWLLVNSCTKGQNISYCLQTSRKCWPSLVEWASVALLKWTEIVLILFKGSLVAETVYIMWSDIMWFLFHFIIRKKGKGNTSRSLTKSLAGNSDAEIQRVCRLCLFGYYYNLKKWETFKYPVTF